MQRPEVSFETEWLTRTHIVVDGEPVANVTNRIITPVEVDENTIRPEIYQNLIDQAIDYEKRTGNTEKTKGLVGMGLTTAGSGGFTFVAGREAFNPSNPTWLQIVAGLGFLAGTTVTVGGGLSFVNILRDRSIAYSSRKAEVAYLNQLQEEHATNPNT